MKKLLLTLGSAAAVVAPLATVVACGDETKAATPAELGAAAELAFAELAIEVDKFDFDSFGEATAVEDEIKANFGLDDATYDSIMDIVPEGFEVSLVGAVNSEIKIAFEYVETDATLTDTEAQTEFTGKISDIAYMGAPNDYPADGIEWEDWKSFKASVSETQIGIILRDFTATEMTYYTQVIDLQDNTSVEDHVWIDGVNTDGATINDGDIVLNAKPSETFSGAGYKIQGTHTEWVTSDWFTFALEYYTTGSSQASIIADGGGVYMLALASV